MSNDIFISSTETFTFTSLRAAAEALLVVLEDARDTDRQYAFTGLTPGRILKDGLVLQGEVVDITTRVGLIAGAVRQGH